MPSQGFAYGRIAEVISNSSSNFGSEGHRSNVEDNEIGSWFPGAKVLSFSHRGTISLRWTTHWAEMILINFGGQKVKGESYWTMKLENGSQAQKCYRYPFYLSHHITIMAYPWG
jgi:hypothetical protein